MLTRRNFMHRALACGVLTQLPRLSFATTAGDSRLVLVILRGALDGLTAVPPYGDPDYANARRELAIPQPGGGAGALALDSTFGLHPSLKSLHQRFQDRELTVLHAVASPYRERSHFDGQNVLENGTPAPTAGTSGWLNRAIAALPPAARAPHELGLALGQNVPLVLRGDERVTSWAPSLLPEVEPDTLARLADLYTADAILAMRLKEATAIDALADQQMGTDRATGNAAARPGAGNVARLKLMASTAGKFLAAADGPRIAVFDATGWDTHAQEGAATGQLAQRLEGLDAVLDTLATSLQPVWKQSAIVVATEFGRTVALNGTRGTDHGTGTCALLLGGAVNGGRVIADWPGLGSRSLYEGRDLKPTLDLRALFKGVLQQHFAISTRQLEESIFPASSGSRPVPDLLRA
ncbi:MAG TPA: DUF1501 domain-containing protein [Steroidobacteraceae bacterium]|nr:DUF1501 domain-containing protein [Steroidobacteraceae bacterium]